VRVVDRVAGGLAARGARAAWGTLPGGEIAEALARAGIRYLAVASPASAGHAARVTARLGGFPGIAVVDAVDAPALAGSLAGIGRERVLGLLHGGAVGLTLGSDRVALLDAEAVDAQLGWVWGPASGTGYLAIRPEVGRFDVDLRGPGPEPQQHGVPDLGPIAERVRAWKRPVIAVGGAGRRAPLDRLAEALRAPVITSPAARGAVPEEAGWSLGALGVEPRPDAALAAVLAEADGVLGVGWDPRETAWGWDLPGAGDRAWLDEPGADLPPGGAVAIGLLSGIVAGLAERATGGASAWEGPEALRPARDAGPSAAIRSLVGGGDVLVVDAGTRSAEVAAGWRCDRPDRLVDAPGCGGAAALAVAESGRRAVLLVDRVGFDRAWPDLVAASDAELPFLVAVLAGEPAIGDPAAAIRSLGGFARRVAAPADLAGAFRDALADDSGRVSAIFLESGAFGGG
jgi:thiamine pyrophosphate-dependent acetolactate synthase large subunit-like protein